ncbi:flagellar synthesis chaperone protein FlgN [Pseudomonas laurentiana]|uniref:Flagellar protein FlgN n=1 Tax=Pseudomonas laurentiana TaxID=2364649 RepID=A0A6I5RSF7_9PSED|nr:flagellar protein FlgN [Pseudomonas laurentiana]NES10843.1 flagellar protein FlgN [Pseudomonas laurentiana]GGU65916.1 flagellar synthesis chaperone protein FlgN [Pseudomonas laurentiana]
MHDITLLQLIEDDIAPAQQLLELLQTELIALHGRDMQLLENILARKQSLVVLLDQQGRRRSQALANLGLSPDRSGFETLASQSSLGKQMMEKLEELAKIMAQCQAANEINGRSIQIQQATTDNQIRILMGGESPSLYDSRGATSPLAKPRTLSQV